MLTENTITPLYLPILSEDGAAQAIMFVLIHVTHTAKTFSATISMISGAYTFREREAKNKTAENSSKVRHIGYKFRLTLFVD